MAAYAQFGPGYHTPPSQFFSRSGLQVPPSLTTHVLSAAAASSATGDGGTQSPIATTSSAPSTSPPLTIGRTDSGNGGIGIGGCSSSGNNSNSSSGNTTLDGGGGGGGGRGSTTPDLISQSTTTTATQGTHMSNSNNNNTSTNNNNNNNNEIISCQNKSSLTSLGLTAAAVAAASAATAAAEAPLPQPPPTECSTSSSMVYPYQSCNTSISAAAAAAAALQPAAVSCCDNGRPVMTDPVSGQMICSCQYDPTRFTALSNYTRIQSAAGIGVYGTPYPSNEQNPYPSIGIESPTFYSSVTHPYALKDNTGASDVTPWTSGGLQGSASYYTYDPTFGAYGYGASYDLASRRKNATRESTATLKAWLNEHKKNPYPTKGEKIMLAIITKMTLTQVSTWFANARRRLKKENKMTWEPKNRTEEDDDALVSDDEKDHDHHNHHHHEHHSSHHGESPTKQQQQQQTPNYSNYDARTTAAAAAAAAANGIGVGGVGVSIPPCGVVADSSVGGIVVGGSGNSCPIPLSNKYSSGAVPSSGDVIGSTTAPTDSDVGVGVLSSAQPKECGYSSLPYSLRDDHHHHAVTLESQMVAAAAVPLYQRMSNYQQESSSNYQPLNGSWRSTQYSPYMDWTRLHAQRAAAAAAAGVGVVGAPPHSPNATAAAAGTAVVATISLQSTSQLEMRPNVYVGTTTASPTNYALPPVGGGGVDGCGIKREPSELSSSSLIATTTAACRNLMASYPSHTNPNETTNENNELLRKGLYCT